MRALIGASIEVSVSDTGTVSSSSSDMSDIVKRELDRIKTVFGQEGILGDPIIALQQWLSEAWHAQIVEPYKSDAERVY